MIYTRNGIPVTVTAACLAPTWIIKTPGKVDVVYQKPKKVPKRAKVTEMASLFVKAEYDKDGEMVPLHDGKWFEAHILKADEGWKEIENKIKELMPTAEKQWKKWDSSTKEASEMFAVLKPKEVC